MPDPTFLELLRVFARIGFLSFGGPAGQVALMHKELVEDRRWVEESAFLRALNLCNLLPGPEAQQLATWIGWRLHGTAGGLATGLLFIAPGALVMLGLSTLYIYAVHLPVIAALFFGIKAAVLAIVAQALIRIGRRALNSRFKIGIAAAAFAALFLLNMPFPLVVIAACLAGFVVARHRPRWLKLPMGSPPAATRPPQPVWQSMRTVAIWLILWWAPMAAIFVTLGTHHILWAIGLFFGKMALVSFGGAYAVLSYVAQEAVQNMHWLSAPEMADGLGLAETTPGPLILVTQYVGFLAAFRTPEPFSPLVAGLLGAMLTTWVTFAPCFLWIFAFAPWMERMEHAVRLQGALATLTAAIVGVIANLSIWFALHVLFGRVDETRHGFVRLYLPDWTSLNWPALAIGAVAALLIFRFRMGMLPTLAISAGLGVATMTLATWA